MHRQIPGVVRATSSPKRVLTQVSRNYSPPISSPRILPHTVTYSIGNISRGVVGFHGVEDVVLVDRAGGDVGGRVGESQAALVAQLPS